MLTKKNLLLILTVVMIVVNIFAIYQYDLQAVRLFRSVTSFIFLVTFVILGGFKKKLMFFALLFFFISDLFINRYDQIVYNNLTSVASTLGYLFIGYYIFPKFKLVSIKKRIVVLFLVIILISAYMFYEVIGLMSASLNNTWHQYLYYLYSLVLLALLILVGNYNFRYNSTQSTYCMFFVFSFVVSDLFAAISYYLGIPMFYYPTRFFYVLGLGLLTAYAVLKFEKELLYEDEGQ